MEEFQAVGCSPEESHNLLPAGGVSGEARPPLALYHSGGKVQPHFRRALGSIVIGELRILSAGVDTLHCAVRAELQDGLLVCRQMVEGEPYASTARFGRMRKPLVSATWRVAGWSRP